MVPTFTYPFFDTCYAGQLLHKKLVIFPTTLLTNEGAFCISQVKENKQKEQTERNVLRVW